jgi:hypothetical protein
LKNLNEPLGERIYESLKGSDKAREELASINDPRAIAPLVKALGAWDGNVRANAAWTLGKFGDRRIVDPLLKSMGDEDPKVREAASRVLEELGEPLGRLIQSTLAGSREAGSELAGRKDPRSFDALILSLRNRDGQVRRAAATVLGKIRDPRAVDGLVVMAGGWGLRDRWVATVALLEIDQKFFPDRLTAVFRVMARAASLVYLLCIAGIPILAMYGSGWIGRRRGSTSPGSTGWAASFRPWTPDTSRRRSRTRRTGTSCRSNGRSRSSSG